GNVHAKTGTLTGVTALSGYARAPGGRTLVFSSVFNGYSGAAPKDVEDRIAVRLAGGGAARTALRSLAPADGGDLAPSWPGGRLPEADAVGSHRVLGPRQYRGARSRGAGQARAAMGRTMASPRAVGAP